MIRIVGVAIAALIATAPAAAAPKSEDEKINALYETLARGAAGASAQTIATAFADDALLLYNDKGPALQSPAFRASLVTMSDKLKADKVSLRSEYRIERRIVSGGLAVDNGVLRRTLTRPDGEAQVQYAKFVVAARLDRDGRWRIVIDASLPANEAAWTGAVRGKGLKFDG